MAAWISRRYRGKNAFILLVLIRLEIDIEKKEKLGLLSSYLLREEAKHRHRKVRKERKA